MPDFHHFVAKIAAINLHDLLLSILAFIVLIGLMVVVHEFGHFIVAKLFKVRVEAFAFGFGPRLFGYKYGETDYKVCLLPLGGYVKMTGENFSELSEAATGTATVAPASDPGALTSHPRWQRMLIGVAGPTANFVLAFVLMVVYFGWFYEVPAVQPIAIEWVTADSPAAQAGFASGDILRSFDSQVNPSWEQLRKSLHKENNRALPVVVERAGRQVPLTLQLSGTQSDLREIGLTPQLVQGPINVDTVIADEPAERAGLQPGDQILAIDGHSFHSLEPFSNYLQTGKGKPVTLTVSRNGAVIPPLVAHPFQQDSTWLIGFTIIPSLDFPTKREPMSFADAVTESRGFCTENSTDILKVLGKLLTHKVAVSQLSGPVGIAQMAGQATKMKGWSPKFGLAASISLNLGIMNLLPFPILDGGMILFLLIESVIRRDININVKERIYQAAFLLLMVFAAFVIFNDFAKLALFAHVK